MGVGHSGEPRILSRPYGIEWSGWRSDTLALQNAGWRLAVSFDPLRQTYQLLMKNDALKLYAITDVQTIVDLSDPRNARYLSSDYGTFQVRACAPDIYVYQVRMDMPSLNFVEIDAAPQMVESRIIRLADLNVFATKQAEQVLIDKADMTVIQHLEAIKKLQSPAQAELRKKARESRDELPRIHLVANLVHYAA